MPSRATLFLAAVFVLNAFMFIPLGQLAGRLMSRLPALQAYSLNLLGSLAGIGLFFVLSLVWTGPSVWMGVAAAGCWRRSCSAQSLSGRRRASASMAVILLALGPDGPAAAS